MADESKKKTADDEIARIVEAAEPGVASAMKVLEITEKHYFSAVDVVTPAPAVVRTASHT